LQNLQVDQSSSVATRAGEKLIEHLKAWLEPEKLAAQECAWGPGQAPAIAAAILELFHLLPPQAAKFLETKGAPPARNLLLSLVKAEKLEKKMLYSN